jgi:hypothetical protein
MTSIRELFVAFGMTPLGNFIRQSTWAFAAVETVHLIGLAVLGGAVILLGLTALGWGMRRQPVAVTALGLKPVFLSALTAMLATGVLLVASKPLRYYLSDPFRLKLLLLVLGVAIYLRLQGALIGLGENPPSLALRSTGALLLFLWLGVGLAGRFIGLI